MKTICSLCVDSGGFSIDNSLSIDEQHQQMRQHLDLAHPYWDLENIGGDPRHYQTHFRINTREPSINSFCQKCHAAISGNNYFCPTCSANTSFIKTNENLDQPLSRPAGRKQLFGIAGSVVLFVGVFTPIISVPIVGSVNYFQNGKGDGVIVLIFALISIGLVFAKKYGGLWVTGFGALAVMLFTFVNFQIRLSEMKDEMAMKLAGNPFRGIADAAMQSIQLQWGWAVLIVGACLLIAAAATKE